MMVRQVLVDISNDARGWLKAWAQDFTEEEAGSSAGIQTNPLAWQLGHIAESEDAVFQLFTGKSGIVPDDVRAVSGTGCPPPTAQTQYRSLAELWQLLDRTHAQLVGLIEEASDADLDRPPITENRFFKSLGQAIYEIALHENYHVGEIGTLRKAFRKKAIG